MRSKGCESIIPIRVREHLVVAAHEFLDKFKLVALETVDDPKNLTWQFQRHTSPDAGIVAGCVDASVAWALLHVMLIHPRYKDLLPL